MMKRRMRQEEVGVLTLLTFVLGLAFGLGASIEINPPEVVDNTTYIVIQEDDVVDVMGVSLDRAKVFEGFEEEVYELRGHCHIGYGTLTDCNNTEILTEELASDQLYEHMKVVEGELIEALGFYEELPVEAKVVLLDMGYNMGVPNLLTFESMLGYMETGYWWHAMLELEDSLYSLQVPDRASANADVLYTLVAAHDQDGYQPVYEF